MFSPFSLVFKKWDNYYAFNYNLQAIITQINNPQTKSVIKEMYYNF